ncbi:OmpA family protein [Pontibacter sp. 172403-2]|uniref:OmpA family protein n=1 Tax=Pontibacter rufus TaxID=2791028 RepID=UPI0018AFD2FD|nr:OmpA family protein [Pontibacter sp. 172403-2]MBF9252369.1 OmpA family protein [Pontibacter sp. 172403-2]
MHTPHIYLALLLSAVLPAQAHSGNGIKAAGWPVTAGTTITPPAYPFNPGPYASWARYDFVPGDSVLFEDNLIGEDKGEFPAHWHSAGGTVEVAPYGSENVLELVDNGTSISPMMATENWLPETSTIEMDLFFATDNPKVAYEIYLTDDAGKNEKAVNGDFSEPLVIQANSVHFKKEGTESAELAAAGVKEKWRHLAIALNKGHLQVYLDQYCLLDMPQVKGKPSGLKIQVKNRTDAETMVKQVFIASGGGNHLDDELATSGKVVTQGIKFIPNYANVLPASMGTLNAIVKLMQEQPNLKFSIESHTDSNGDNRFNMTLSQKRAEATKALLVNLGIAPERLSARGWGETKPLNTSNASQAQPNNRRTEFVRQ